MSGTSTPQIYQFNAGTVETFIVPQTGTYSIAAFGGQGGKPDSGYTNAGGGGGEAAADFVLTQGATLEVVTGGAGGSGDAPPLKGGDGGGGGGGGSFVVLDQDGTLAPLIVAGGGGGDPGEDGGDTIGGNGQGGTFDASPGGGGGGGFYGDGQASTATIAMYPGPLPQGGSNSTGGKSFSSGSAGGSGGTFFVGFYDREGGPGGYGGGGGGGPSEGGGGGGYTGGNAGQGGSSFVASSAVGTPIIVAGENMGPVNEPDITAVSGEVLIEYPACFLQGTCLAGPAGAVPIETVRPGDRLWSERRGRAVPVVWVGRRRFDCTRHPRPEAVLPVRLCAGAFGPGRPARDLLLSPDHAVFFADVLIPVRALIDGAAVVQEPAGSVTYWHVELDEHDVILAEGLPVESFLDAGSRGAYAAGTVAQLHPDFAARQWEAAGCAPLRLVGPEVEAARAVLLRIRSARQVSDQAGRRRRCLRGCRTATS